jgi:RNA polymerase sigma-70 factor (ECF subfamily)
LVRRYEPTIRRVARVRLMDSRLQRLVDSLDICQLVFGSFFVRTALGEYDLDTPEQLLNLLVDMSRKKVVDQARRAGAARRDFGRERGAVDERQWAAAEASPSEQVAGAEQLHEFRRRLSADERRLADKRAAGLGWIEIAAERGESPEALRKQLAGHRPRFPGTRTGREPMIDATRLTTSLYLDQRERWRRGDPVPVESYLERHPSLANHPDGVLDLIYNEIVLRDEAGESPRLEEYQRRFARFDAQLRLLFEVHQALEHAPPSRAGSPTGSQTPLLFGPGHLLGHAPGCVRQHRQWLYRHGGVQHQRSDRGAAGQLRLHRGRRRHAHLHGHAQEGRHTVHHGHGHGGVRAYQHGKRHRRQRCGRQSVCHQRPHQRYQGRWLQDHRDSRGRFRQREHQLSRIGPPW